jgi:hypothetical protein
VSSEPDGPNETFGTCVGVECGDPGEHRETARCVAWAPIPLAPVPHQGMTACEASALVQKRIG